MLDSSCLKCCTAVPCTNVQDSILTIHTILFKGRRAVGVIRKFVSCCEESCDVYTDATFCYHYMIVDTYTLSPFGNITNAEAAHVMRTENQGKFRYKPIKIIMMQVSGGFYPVTSLQANALKYKLRMESMLPSSQETILKYINYYTSINYCR